ncbi:MAG: calcineurin-like phosphoesterase family protein [Phycisphaerae bacterium]|nr:calcineurin-like phosphoesterase family protein [Phycisphaerae bacterium]
MRGIPRLNRSIPLIITCILTLPAGAQQIATGVVYNDANKNGQRDADEKGIPGVGVSNGRDVVETDASGQYKLPVDDNTVIFVIKPRDWMTSVNELNMPRFYYVHAPNGSPELEFGGIAPTGPLPKSVDFALQQRPEPDKFDVVVFGDTQPRDQVEIDYIAHDVVEELIDAPGSFGVTMGDVVFDNLSLYDSLNRAVGHIGMPWYSVPGNHDENYDATDDRYALETFKRTYGPPYYSLDCGNVHFMVLDDVIWVPGTEGKEGRYKAGIAQDEMEFIRNDLARVPEAQLVVMMFHIPIWEMENLKDLAKIIDQRPHALSISAHTHTHINYNLTYGERWPGEMPHRHLVAGTVCGSWWAGAPDEYGIPHTQMRDGTPNGYIIASFDGNKYSWRYKAARRPASFQMSIFVPEAVPAADTAETDVIVNFFNGDQNSKVRMRVRGGEWRELTWTVRPDPFYVALKEVEGAEDYKAPGRKSPKPVGSTHIWVGKLPGDLATGSHVIEVEATDPFGQTFTGHRIFRVE